MKRILLFFFQSSIIFSETFSHVIEIKSQKAYYSEVLQAQSLSNCPDVKRFGRQPPEKCTGPVDPNLKPRSKLEKWFTKEMWQDLFPFSNQGWGNHKCLPYSFEAFIIASRYFPAFGSGINEINVQEGQLTRLRRCQLIQERKSYQSHIVLRRKLLSKCKHIINKQTISDENPEDKTIETEKFKYSSVDLARRDVAAFFTYILNETGNFDNNFSDGGGIVDDASYTRRWLNASFIPNYESYQKHKMKLKCAYYSGFFHYFEGGPKSKIFFNPKKYNASGVFAGSGPCVESGRYCKRSPEIDFWYPCKVEPILQFIAEVRTNYFNASNERVKRNKEKLQTVFKQKKEKLQTNTVKNLQMFDDSSENNVKEESQSYFGCYFGRGPFQLAWNYNYGEFQEFLSRENLEVDLLSEPNQIVTKLDPPLAMLSALWFYMTPKPPKPSMHQIMMGDWYSGKANKKAGYFGSVFGPTNLIFKDKCTDKDCSVLPNVNKVMSNEDEISSEENNNNELAVDESNRVKTFKWFCEKLGTPPGLDHTLLCSGMKESFYKMAKNAKQKISWKPDWKNLWKSAPCNCKPSQVAGAIPYYDPQKYPQQFVRLNEYNQLRCVYSIYKMPQLYNINKANTVCLNYSFSLSSIKRNMKAKLINT